MSTSTQYEGEGQEISEPLIAGENVIVHSVPYNSHREIIRQIASYAQIQQIVDVGYTDPLTPIAIVQ